MRYTFLFLILAVSGLAQAQKFTLADTLRGTLSPIRSCFDVTYYDLKMDVDIENKSISGVNHIHFQNEDDFDSLQIDLFDNMLIDSILFKGKQLRYSRMFNAIFVSFPTRMKKGETGVLSVYYHGTPIAAKNAPWDGGFVWKEDGNGRPFVGVACEGTGASLWWPNKDHLSDEPDSMRISCKIPDGLMCVSNGELESNISEGGKTAWNWKISYPINNYNVTLNIADYAHFTENYENASHDNLKLDYYVLKENLEKAKEQFKQVPEMMACFEEAFGPYPFYKDGYALVETSYLGMEHQGAIAYGNKYMPGYMGRHPEGINFDYIIIHETGHEWWGNSVSMKDAADMWIHESFCTYSEAVFVECKYGYDKMLDYLLYQRNFINNKTPIYGIYGLNQEGNGGDMYYKGSWMIHTFRNVLNNDSLFRSILKGIAEEFKHRTVDGEEIITYINTRAKYDHTPFFNQYLKFSDVPVLEYRIVKKALEFRWKAEAEGFRMPAVFVGSDGVEKRILVTNQDWTSVPMSKKDAKELKFRDDLFLFLPKQVL
ncbi:MAG: M1 family metallopeptidase [Flavobacteriales bacterium]|nr:M1 family metallopeptidase [Flavobacteriales bacterium]